MTTKSKGRGQRIVCVTDELIQDIFVNGARFEINLPDDARLIDFIQPHNSCWDYWLKFESSEWEELNEGEKIPFVTVQMEVERNDREYFFSMQIN